MIVIICLHICLNNIDNRTVFAYKGWLRADGGVLMLIIKGGLLPLIEVRPLSWCAHIVRVCVINHVTTTSQVYT